VCNTQNTGHLCLISALKHSDVCVCVCVCVFLVSQLGRINVRVVGSDIRFTFSVRAREERQKASWFEQVAVLGTNSVNMP